jgi:hypothetical protein
MATRPFGVTLVAIIAWVTGAIGIVRGIFVLIGGGVPVGLTAIVLGAIVVLVSGGLFSGTRGARTLVAIVFVLNIAAAVYGVIVDPSHLWAGLGLIAFPLIGLVLLFTGSANKFFKNPA